MAAKQQGKKKARDMKRKKAQKKHQQARQKQKKLQPRKQKKHQPRLKRQAKRTSAAKAGSSEQQSKICSPRLFASKILRQMPKVRMEAKARGLMKTLLTDLYDHVATQVETLSQRDEQSIISCTDVQAALKEAMEKELAKHTAEQSTPSTTECA
ncbi:histone H2B.v3-like [Rhineura floridana]|uniref:histone H2B.v3-like n=1 Tax=Rhineura floridana TaxID=261503 RepID=UPI002AC8331C|nr:histone H2B.v3-like [Rhineura floridana]XP_061475026.1 histone H2B.v3-like [Rhineura floridana]